MQQPTSNAHPVHNQRKFWRNLIYMCLNVVQMFCDVLCWDCYILFICCAKSLDVSGPLPCTQWTSSLRASPAPARFEINSPGVTPKALTICAAYIHLLGLWWKVTCYIDLTSTQGMDSSFVTASSGYMKAESITTRCTVCCLDCHKSKHN